MPHEVDSDRLRRQLADLMGRSLRYAFALQTAALEGGVLVPNIVCALMGRISLPPAATGHDEAPLGKLPDLSLAWTCPAPGIHGIRSGTFLQPMAEFAQQDCPAMYSLRRDTSRSGSV